MPPNPTPPTTTPHPTLPGPVPTEIELAAAGRGNMVVAVRQGEPLLIGDDIVVTFADIDRTGRARLIVKAPREVEVDRQDVRAARIMSRKCGTYISARDIARQRGVIAAAVARTAVGDHVRPVVKLGREEGLPRPQRPRRKS